ncbi:MAG: 30S ribosomal protein S17 [Candidatus Dojkabacteria bacterium]|jgi:small subunit ribosomal protein S17
MENSESKKGKKRELEGVVVNNKMEKTVKVRVDTTQSHPVYKKVINRRKIFFARTDEELEIGDKVVIRESRPYSKNVRWIVVKK